MLEEGIDLPKCNLVIGFDPPNSFRSYIFSKSKASANNANFFLMYELPDKDIFVNDLAKYYEIEQVSFLECNFLSVTSSSGVCAKRSRSALVFYKYTIIF